MFVFLRLVLAALVMMIVVSRHRREIIDFVRAHGLHAMIIGAMGLGLTQGLLFTALGSTSAVNTGIIFAIAPILTLFLAHFIVSEALGPWQVLGSFIAFCGIVIVAVKGSLTTLTAFQFSIGDLLALVAALCFALYTVLMRKAKFQIGRLPLLTVFLIGAVLLTLPLTLWEVWNGEHENLGPKGLLMLAYIAIPGGAFMYLLLNWSVDILGASKSSTLMYTQMIFTAVLAWLFLGEAILWYHFVGAGLVIVGVVIVTEIKERRAEAAGK
jgi:drug/metabolite transporter (DMT)-like permease